LVLAYYPQSMLRSLGANSNYPPQNSGVGDLSPLAMEFEEDVGDWFDLAFQKRIPLTINGGQVPSTQTDFPLLINDTYPDMIGEVEAEIRFAGTDLVQLEYEIAKFDNSTGELIAWTKKPTVSNGDIVNIYFDNPGATDEQNSPGVYDANYNRVYHLNNDADDSTGNAEDLTIFTGTSAGFVPGKIGNAYDFPGNNVTDYMIRNPVSVWPSTEFTLEHWLKVTGTIKHMFSYAVTGFFNEVLAGINSSGRLRSIVHVSLHDFSSGGVFNDGQFHKVDMRWKSQGGQLDYFLDGSFQATFFNIAINIVLTNGGSIVLGQDQDSVGGGFQPSQALVGLMEEVMFSDSFRSSDYLKTKFNNQNSNSTFYSTGAVESAPTGFGNMEFETFGPMEFEL